MSDRSKYSLNGVYRCENFAQQVENDDFPRFPIGSALGFVGWYIRLRITIGNGRTLVFPFISHQNHFKIQVRAYFNILKKDGSSAFESESGHIYLESYEGCKGSNMDSGELLDEENGYLDDGALTVEYGLQVDAEEGHDGIWNFNFSDLFFNWQNKDNMFDFVIRHESSLFGHKQIVYLHSKMIFNSKKLWVRVPKSFNPGDFVMCLQTTHGVRSHLTAEEIERIIGIAFRFGFSNTVRYCERQLIEKDEQTKMKLTRKIKLAVKFNMERYLSYSIKQIKSPERLMRILKRLNIEKMSSESMKTFFEKYLDLIDFLE